jgi:hypothetical protein
MRLAWILLTLLCCHGLLSAQKQVPEDFCVSIEEQLLFDKINLLREDYGKPAIEFSVSLSYVADVHVNDLLLHRPDTSICNLSSWSDKGDWTPCCHNSYVPQQDCMWDKPKELTPYPYRGYELAGYFEDGLTADSVLNLWSSSKPVLDMILTEGHFKQKKWICMGVGFNERYVSVWFGQRSDRLGEPEICISSDTVLSAAVAQDSTATTYYLIIGSFSNMRDAREALRRYTKNGFDQAGTISSDGKIRIYLNKFQNLKEAMYAKQQLPYTYRDAWVYKE